MRAFIVGVSLLAVVACGGTRKGGGDDDDGPDACVGMQCQVVNCQKMNKPDTELTGTVFAPNGTLPLFGINVYVPNSDPGPLTDGATCARCSDNLPGNPIVQASTDDSGKFSLKGVPAGDNIPLVITSGKWRRQIVIPHIDACASTPIDPVQTRLPKNKTEGDIPKIAITTGSADSLECLVRRLGIDDSEITTSTGAGRIHLYHGNGVATITGGGTMTEATPFWSSVDNLKKYDIVILSCEGAQNSNTKPQVAMDAMKAYADLGGRVFASHWHNVWIEGDTEGSGTGQRPQVWPNIANWSNGGSTIDPTTDLIDEVANGKGVSFANWMLNVGGSTTRDQIPIQGGTGRTTCTMNDASKAERWTYLQGQGGSTQNFQFTTPNEVASDQRCGKVVFSDMHVSGGPLGGSYPASCGGTLTLSPQEKALAFMFFDIASCVGSIF